MKNDASHLVSGQVVPYAGNLDRSSQTRGLCERGTCIQYARKQPSPHWAWKVQNRLIHFNASSRFSRARSAPAFKCGMSPCESEHVIVWYMHLQPCRDVARSPATPINILSMIWHHGDKPSLHICRSQHRVPPELENVASMQGDTSDLVRSTIVHPTCMRVQPHLTFITTTFHFQRPLGAYDLESGYTLPRRARGMGRPRICSVWLTLLHFSSIICVPNTLAVVTIKHSSKLYYATGKLPAHNPVDLCTQSTGGAVDPTRRESIDP